jgi:hypothetical protein
MSHRSELTLRERKLLLRARRGQPLPRWFKPVGLLSASLMVVAGLVEWGTGDAHTGGMTVGFGGGMAGYFLCRGEIEEWLSLVRKLDAERREEPNAEG